MHFPERPLEIWSQSGNLPPPRQKFLATSGVLTESSSKMILGSGGLRSVIFGRFCDFRSPKFQNFKMFLQKCIFFHKPIWDLNDALNWKSAECSKKHTFIGQKWFQVGQKPFWQSGIYFCHTLNHRILGPLKDKMVPKVRYHGLHGCRRRKYFQADLLGIYRGRFATRRSSYTSIENWGIADTCVNARAFDAGYSWGLNY